MGRPRESLEKKFWKAVEKTDGGCWLWKSSRSNIYGSVCLTIDRKRKRRMFAHRASWLIHRGEIPEPLRVYHRCENSLCVNPEHLFLGKEEDSRNPEMILKKFWDRVDVRGPDECWPWKGGKTVAGYGILASGRQAFKSYAHRFSYALTKPLSPEQSILHKCDNPICVNPAHLRAGTHAENIADCVQKGRMPKGSQHHNAKLVEDEVLIIRKELRAGANTEELAESFDVSKWTIEDIHKNKTWRHLEQ